MEGHVKKEDTEFMRADYSHSEAWKNRKLVEAVVPELDAEGQIIRITC